MAKYECKRNFIGRGGLVLFNKGEKYFARCTTGYRSYHVKSNDTNTYYAMSCKAFHTCFKRAFIFGR